jgi:hypothetical protein
VANRTSKSGPHDVFWSVGRGERVQLAASLVDAAGRIIIVARNTFDARRLADELSRHGVPSSSPERRDFHSKSVRVQVVTDETAGACVPAPCVLQFDPAPSPRVHRRRLDLAHSRVGVAVTLVVPERDGEARELLQRIGQTGDIVAPDLEGLLALFDSGSWAGVAVDADTPPNALAHAASVVRRTTGEVVRRAPRLGRTATRAIRRVVRRRPTSTDT